jgi:hypothetical protein
MTIRDRRRTERGATAVVVAILLVALAGFLALVMNVGHLMTVRAQLHNATDSAALAGARELNGTVAGLANARIVAADYAFRHMTDSLDNPDPDARIVINPDTDVLFGHWYQERPRPDAFEEITGRTPADLNWINAVLVRDGREASRGNDVSTIMAGLFSRKATDVTAESVAVMGGPCSEGCAIPITFAECVVVNPDGTLRCDEELVFNSDTTDNVGFTNLTDDPTVSTNVLRQILQGACRSVNVGDYIAVGNGNNLNPVFSEFSALIGQEVSAPITRLPGGCPAKYNEHPEGAEIIGFATFKLVGVDPPPNNALHISMECDKVQDRPANAGCTFFGMTPMQPRLVR